MRPAAPCPLTPEQVARVKAVGANRVGVRGRPPAGAETMADLAREFGVHRNVIRRAARKHG